MLRHDGLPSPVTPAFGGAPDSSGLYRESFEKDSCGFGLIAHMDDKPSHWVVSTAIGALHRHPHSQITYIQAGAFKVHIGAETRVLRGGDFYLIPTGVEHGVEALEDSILVDFFAPMREDFVPAAAEGNTATPATP